MPNVMEINGGDISCVHFVHDSNQELIDVNKSKLADIISNLLVLIFGISIVAWIIEVIRLF